MDRRNRVELSFFRVCIGIEVIQKRLGSGGSEAHASGHSQI